MRVTPSKVKAFLEKPDAFSGVLVHGSDNSKVDFYTQQIAANLDGYSTQIMDFVAVNKSPGLLFSELANFAMFSDKKLIKLINVAGSISKELKSVLNDNIGDHYLIFVANDLPYNSSTKAYMESSKKFGVVACYKDNNSNLQDAISHYFKQNNIEYANEIIRYLQSYFNHNKLPIRSELEKLVLYLGERKNLSLADIELCFSTFGGNYYVTLDNLCSAIANKDIARFIEISNTLISQENFSPIALIRIMLNYFFRLENVLFAIQDGVNEQDAIDGLLPPLFFTQLQNFKSHLRSLKLSELRKVLDSLINLEVMCKKTNLDHKMLFQQHFI
ncbi:MAG: hypothetical protein PG981_000721 [Wolbachia endosymbiont of Ctenocephalides orientis wCori]|nr:MAG: hypothetical protein PG981_000721 [Wolbachia endosymbiont of Ctenocephalides orientis wCori]